ncbi:MAG: hypothetical protein AAGD38_09710 [Acidobacteriota bacterium]
MDSVRQIDAAHDIADSARNIAESQSAGSHTAASEQTESPSQVEALCRRLQLGLRRELDRRHGQIGAIEARIGRSPVYLRRLAGGQWQPTVDALFEAVLGLGLDPSSFLEHSLDLTPKPEAILLTLEADADGDSELRAIERALRAIELGESHTETPAANIKVLDSAACQREIAALEALSRSEQRRRLRTKKALRRAVFIERLIDHLDEARHDAPAQAAALARPLLGITLARSEDPPERLLELACRGLGMLGAAYRQLNELPRAARMLRAGLELAERRGYDLERAHLLRRVAVVLESHREYERGLAILREAGEIYHDYGDRAGFAAVSVSRGLLLSRLEQYERANRVLRDAESFFLKQPTSSTNRHHLTAIYQRLSANLLLEGVPDEAEGYIRRARVLWERAGGFVYGQLLWSCGILARESGHLEASRGYLSEADKIITGTDNAVGLFDLKIELCLTLAELGDTAALAATVRSALPLTATIGNRHDIAEDLREFLSLGMAGELTPDRLRDMARRRESTEH